MLLFGVIMPEMPSDCEMDGYLYFRHLGLFDAQKLNELEINLFKKSPQQVFRN